MAEEDERGDHGNSGEREEQAARREQEVRSEHVDPDAGPDFTRTETLENGRTVEVEDTSGVAFVEDGGNTKRR